MDYDKTAVPDTYDAGRERTPEQKLRFLRAYAERTGTEEINRIIDLGCGTGRYTQTLAEVFDADVLGVEPSDRMREQAEAKTDSGHVTIARGTGDEIPAEDGAADLILMSMVLHHLPDIGAVARECARVLRPGGFACIWNTVQDEAGTYPYHGVFPSIRAIIDRKLTPRAELDGLFEAQSLELFHRETVPHVVAPDWQTLADKMALRADSFVAELSDAEHAAGLERLRELAAKGDGSPSVLQVDRIIYRRR